MIKNVTSRKWAILNQYILVNTNNGGKWFAIFEHTINSFSFGCVRLSQSEYYFSSFLSLLLLFFLLLLRLSTFKRPNAWYSKFERLKISGRTRVRRKSGVPGWETALNRVLQKFKL